MSTCPSTSPQGKVPCMLEDTEIDHYLGHEGLDRKSGGHVVAWGVSREDYKRWESSADG